MSRLGAVALVGATVASLGVLGLATAHAPKLVVLNESPSLARGLYVRAPSQAAVRGAVVAIAQPGNARAYLAGLRMPVDVPLLKRVVATAGDSACAAAGRVQLPDRILQVRARDRFGAALPVWRGCRRLAAGEVFVVGDTPNSFDSRYFGPVPHGAVEGVFRRLVTW